jgi:hypothetical protein
MRGGLVNVPGRADLFTSCVACARIHDAGVHACLSDLLRVPTQGRRPGRMGQAGYASSFFIFKLARSRRWETHTLTVPVSPRRDSLGWRLLPAVSARYRPRSRSVFTHDDRRLLFLTQLMAIFFSFSISRRSGSSFDSKSAATPA